MSYQRRSLDVFAPLLVALRASVAMSASVCLSVCLSHARSHISETVHSPQTLLVFNSVLPVAGARSCPGSRSCTSGFFVDDVMFARDHDQAKTPGAVLG